MCVFVCVCVSVCVYATMCVCVSSQAAVAQLKSEHDALQRRIREKELLIRQCKTAQASLDEARDALPNVRFQVCVYVLAQSALPGEYDTHIVVIKTCV